MVLKLFAKLGQIQTVRFNNVAIFLAYFYFDALMIVIYFVNNPKGIKQ